MCCLLFFSSAGEVHERQNAVRVKGAVEGCILPAVCSLLCAQGKKKVIARNKAYHGVTAIAASCSGLPGVIPVSKICAITHEFMFRNNHLCTRICPKGAKGSHS